MIHPIVQASIILFNFLDYLPNKDRRKKPDFSHAVPTTENIKTDTAQSEIDEAAFSEDILRVSFEKREQEEVIEEVVAGLSKFYYLFFLKL